jgi:rhodanese-related sulfurtransferase
MSLLQSLFGIGGPKVDLAQKIKEGATIIDVRTPEEFKSGHVKGSINIPLDKVQNQSGKLDKTKAVITCCRSGARSGMAADVLKRNGFECYNGGPWTSVRALKG